MPSALVYAARPTRLRIPAISVDVTRFVDLDLNADGTLEVPADAHTVGWYARSPAPGRPGPAVLAAHVNWGHQKGVFYDLHTLQIGENIAVDRSDGSTGTFQVARVARHPKNGLPTQEVYGDVPGPELRLITCGGALGARPAATVTTSSSTPGSSDQRDTRRTLRSRSARMTGRHRPIPSVG
jgi:sortase (surface protein transpeptidase)